MLTPTHLVLFRALFFFLYSSIGILSPFFALHLRSGVGLSDRNVSLIVGIHGVGFILFQQMWGYAADCLLPKKTLLLICMLGSGVLYLLVGYLTNAWSIAFGVFAFHSLFTSINQLLHGFLFSHPGSERYFGLFLAWGSLGFVVMNVGVGILADRLTGGSLMFIFHSLLLVMIISALLIAPIPEYRLETTTWPSFWGVQKFFLRNRQVMFFLLLAFVYQVAHAPTFALQALLMADMGADRSTIAASYSLAALLELPIFFAASRLIARFGAPKLILFCALLQTVRWVLVWASTSPVQIIFVSMIHCFTFGLFFAAAVTYMNSHAGPLLKASAQTIFAMVYLGLAGVVGSVAGGLALSGGVLSPATRFLTTRIFHLPDHGDLPNMYLACSVIAGVSVLLAVGLIFVENAAARRLATTSLHRSSVAGATHIE